MGFSISWLAVCGKPKADILAELALADTAQATDADESEMSGALLPGGWYVIYLNEFWHTLVQPETVAALSSGATVVGCAVEEHAMASLAFLYKEGECVWQVSHVLDRGHDHLDIDGQAPDATSALLQAAIQRHEAEGHDAVFNVPVDLAFQACGFRHDAEHALEFTELFAQD